MTSLLDHQTARKILEYLPLFFDILKYIYKLAGTIKTAFVNWLMAPILEVVETTINPAVAVGVVTLCVGGILAVWARQRSLV